MTKLVLILLFVSGTLLAQTAQTPELPRIGGRAPEFAFSAVIQGDGVLADSTPEALRGRVVVLEFFATTCAPCVAAIPRTRALVEEFKSDPVSFLAVANEPRAVLEAFLSTHPMSADLVLDDGDRTYRNYRVRAPPFVVVIDTTGHISAFASPETLSSAQIRSALKRSEAAAAAAQAAGRAALGAVESLPEFSLGNLAGERQSIRSWPGKPLLISFWATWCVPCLREIPMLKELQTTRSDLQVVGIAIDERDPVVEFAGRLEFNYPILIGQSEAWAAVAALGVNVYVLPFTIFTAPDGSILGVHSGELHPEHLENFRSVIDDLAAERIDLAAARSRLAGRI